MFLILAQTLAPVSIPPLACLTSLTASTAGARPGFDLSRASQQAVNSKVEFKFALDQAGQTSAAQALTAAQYCSFLRVTDPSVVLPAAAYLDTASTCEAVPSETASACAAAARLDAPHRKCKCTGPPCILLACSPRKCAIHCFALLCFGFVHKQRRKGGVANHFLAFSQHTQHTATLHPG